MPFDNHYQQITLPTNKSK